MAKRLLDARPRKAPKWWPRAGRSAAWVGVLKDGDGWVLGDGTLMTAPERHKARKFFNEPRCEFRTRSPK